MTGPIKGVSSYDKICTHLRYTQDFSDFSARAFKILDNANVAGWEFRPGGDEYTQDPLKMKNVAPPVVHLLVELGKKVDGKDNIETVGGDPRNWIVGVGRVCDEDELNAIVHKNWDTKACPTYFCKKAKLLGEEVNEKGKSVKGSYNKWAAFARNLLEKDLADKIVQTQDKLRQAMMVALASPEFEVERVAFYERCIVEDIKKVLLRYSAVAKPHVYKQALDEFVAHEIMEC